MSIRRIYGQSLGDREMGQSSAKGELTFQYWWFPENDPVLQAQLGKFNGHPDICGVEIGSWEGRSACWILANVINGPNSRLHCIDPWDVPIGEAIEARFDSNIAIAEKASRGRVTKCKGRSEDILPKMSPNELHFAYVDGSHVAADVLSDMVLAWRLLRVGGVMVCDDYELTKEIKFRGGRESYPEVPPLERPKMAIDAFMTCYEGRYELLHMGWQVVLAKRAV